MVRSATFSPGKAFAVTAVKLTEDGYEVELEDRRTQGWCPACGSCSVRSYGWHRRTLQDLPIGGRAVKHRLALRRWRCANERCGRRTFTDADVTVFDRHGRRTLRYDEIVFHMGRALGGLPAERLFERLGLSISDDTVLRHLSRKTEEKEEGPPPRVVGIDDWAWKKQHTYGTIMLDLERNVVIDVLETRDRKAITAWLTDHPSIEVVSRDRAGTYAKAAREALPNAEQVADRFHLVENFQGAIQQQFMHRQHASKWAVMRSSPEGEDGIDEETELTSSATDVEAHERTVRMIQRASLSKDAKEAIRLFKADTPIKEIASCLGYKRKTIERWLTYGRAPDRNAQEPAQTNPRKFEAYLRQRWDAGERHGPRLLEELRGRGYRGSKVHLYRFLSPWRKTDRFCAWGSGREPETAPLIDPATGHRISAITAAALCVKPRPQLTKAQAIKVDALKSASPAFCEMRKLAMQFRALFRTKDPSRLEPWLEAAMATGLKVIMRFAGRMRRDQNAVENAIALPWSNGQAEGQIARLKMIKRSMYGRAGIDLLKARLVGA